MKPGSLLFRYVTSICCLLVAAAAANAQGGFNQVSAVPPINLDVSKIKIIQRIGNQLPTDAQFTDQDGRAVTIGSLLGKRPALLLGIFYRCTGVCGVELANLVSTLDSMKTKRIGRDFDVIVVGIDPVETPELAKAKLNQTIATSANLKGTDAGWHFLTGKLGSIRSVTNPLGFYYTYDEATDVVNHAAGLMFITPTGVVSSYILGANYTSEAISTNIDIAAKNQLGVKSTDIFFGCIHIDPLTGKRSIVIQNVLKVAAVVTVMALGLTILTLSGKARWRKKRSTGLDEWGEPVDD